jgi:hypothetical protein
MATMLGECATKEQRSVVHFLWAKGLNVKDSHKEMFPVYGGKCLSCKVVHSWVAKVSLMTKRLKRRCGSGWDNSEKTSMLRVSTHWESDGTSVSMSVEDTSRNKCFFPALNIKCFTFHIHLWPIFWLSLVEFPDGNISGFFFINVLKK